MRRVHRWLVHAAPRALRDQYADDMAETADALYDEAAARGRRALAILLARESASVARAHGAVFLENTRMLLSPLFSASQTRTAFRALWRRPAFTITILLTLILGTAATTTIFAVVDRVLLRPLPYPDAEQLVAIYESLPARSAKIGLIAPARMADWRTRNQTFVEIGGSYAENVTDTSGADPERLQARRVTAHFFDVFGAAPTLGRTFKTDEEQFEGPLAVVISDAVWTSRYQRSPNVLDQHMIIGGKVAPIVGVMPAAFAPTGIDAWLPAQFPPFLLTVRDARFVSGIARLKPGVTVEQARADMARVQEQLGREFPATDAGWTASITPLRGQRIGDTGRTLWILFAAIGALWLIGIANIAGLMLVQLQQRQRELTVRLAIGASRMQMIAGVVHEVVLVASIGAAAGVALASALLKMVPVIFPALPRAAELTLDGRAIGFAVATACATALLCGVWPAWSFSRRSLAETLAQGGRGASSIRHRAQRLLVTAQVALSLLLCGSASLLVRSYFNLTTASVGFSAEDVLTFHAGARWDEDRVKVGLFQQQLLERVSALPGVEAAGMTNFLPMDGATLRAQVSVDGIGATEKDGILTAGTRTIGHNYLRALSIPVIRGEGCPAAHVNFTETPPALVNRSFVDRFADGKDVIGRTIRMRSDGQATFTIAGVVGDVSEDTPSAPASPYVYLCMSAGAWPDPEYVVKTHDAAGTTAGIRMIARTLDRSRAIFGLRPLGSMVDDTRLEPRLNAGVLAGLAGAALVVSAIGLYGLFMLLVSERLREIGVRLALGATSAQVVTLVSAGAGRLLAVGIGSGLVLCAVARRFLASVLFGVSPLDPLTLGVAVAALTVVAALAVAMPLVRASRVSPTEVMRGS